MTFLRHSSRHIHYTVAEHVQAGLASLNWTDPALTPFGAPAVTFDLTRSASDFVTTPKGLAAGLVCITLGNEQQPDPEELGGVLHQVDLPIFVDLFMNLDAHAQTLAEDIRDIFLGRVAFHPSRFLNVVDQATSTVVQGWKIEFEDVERIRPEHAFALTWQVVKVTCQVRYPEVS